MRDCGRGFSFFNFFILFFFESRRKEKLPLRSLFAYPKKSKTQSPFSLWFQSFHRRSSRAAR